MSKEEIWEIGDTVQNKETGELATVKYSTFGIKVGGLSEEGYHWKSNGGHQSEFEEYWELIKS